MTVATRSRLGIELEQALGFGEAELAANRDGHITRRQAIRLAIRDVGIWLGFAFVAILLIGIVLCMVVFPFLVFPTQGLSLSSLVTIALSEAVLFVFALVFRYGANYFLRQAQESVAELRSGAVLSREGTMSAVQERVEMVRGYSYVHFVVAGDERYRIPFAVYRIFEDGEDYRLFYMPETGVVVAIEAIDRFGQSARLRHRHRWGHLDGQLWWPIFLASSAGIVAVGVLIDKPSVAVLGVVCLLVSAIAAVNFVRGL